MKIDSLSRWTHADAIETYGVDRWGQSHFTVNAHGNLAVDHDGQSIDLKDLVDELIARGIQLPVLLRFPCLLEARIRMLNQAFMGAIEEYRYGGTYRGVFPIKVNQSRKVVEAITRFGRPFHYGLEAGSKPELLAVMALLDDEQALVVCNGYKDDSYIETALLASKLRHNLILVVEKPHELGLIRTVSERLAIEPSIGLRMKLSARGAGRWEGSGGDHAKFGLSASEMLEATVQLRRWGMLDSVRLLHFHLGSQITAIRSLKDALREASRMYVELVKLGCQQLDFFDVGGGLGVDYDGSQTNFDSSMNYSVQEYANDVVWAVQEACDGASIAHPTVVSESGRAVAAHHSVLVVNVIGTSSTAPAAEPAEPQSDASALSHNLWELHASITRKNARECYHDLLEYKEQLVQLFNLGSLSLQERAHCEDLFWASCHRIAEIFDTSARIPKELKMLQRFLSDTYFCNFSLFQSVPDSWAVDQLFPIMPIHRLLERPTRRATIADITCDSDGTIDAFIDPRDVQSTLPVHQFNGSPYYLGMMLTGAYQEILGDLHNLFGDTNVVNVQLGEGAGYQIDEVVNGDTVADVLRYVDYDASDLTLCLRKQVDAAVREKTMTSEESHQLMRRFRNVLAAYTYLE